MLSTGERFPIRTDNKLRTDHNQFCLKLENGSQLVLFTIEELITVGAVYN